MLDTVTSFLLVLFFSSGVIVASEAGSATVWAVVMAAAVVVIVLLQAVSSPRSVRAALVRAGRAIDVSVALAQSDPDAAGHPRSRAPGIAASAA